MNERHSRRSFFKHASALSLAAVVGGKLGGALTALAQEPTKLPTVGRLKTSLNAYSFARLLNDNLKHRGPGVTLIQVMEFAAKNKFDGFDATGYYFPTYPEVPKDDYVKQLKTRAADLGIGISGTGVRNNFTTSDKTVRAAAVQHIKEWVEVAAQLGAPVIRVFSDTQMRAMTWHDVAKGFTYGQVQEWIADDLRQCAEHGKKFGVCIGVQNHGDFIATGEQQMALMKAVNSDFCSSNCCTCLAPTATCDGLSEFRYRRPVAQWCRTHFFAITCCRTLPVTVFGVSCGGNIAGINDQ